jgi:23S rRNA pseudouridine1911/1915/1917 synthase
MVIPAPIPLDVTAENIPLTILYEDDDVIVVDKPAGMVTHPSAGHLSGTLVNAILGHCRHTLSGVGGVMRPGIVHRLDRDTSGAIIIAKNDFAHEHLAAQLKSRKLSRTYVAVVKGGVKTAEGIIDAPIGRSHADRKKMGVREDGREAVSLYRVTQKVNKASVVEVSLKTGRTHQIRVHMLYLGYPVAGDAVYGRSAGGFHIKRQALHAWRLTFVHPRTGADVTVTAPLPNDMVALIKSLGGDPAAYL